MIAVIFEVEPNPGCQQAYMDIAAELKPHLEDIDGFLSIERFESLTQPGRILSLSFWRDEDAVHQWKNFEAHRAAQIKGKQTLFADYRLRVAHVVRDYGMEGKQ
ncbi:MULTISPECIES: antibiotic biosynthesis monooxygenase family protein [Halomonas]|uniref:Antibiotic biosynthesis monooxygenase n=1 Tax=Halomonas binhaiensis TaxID=2562282 RepID=A0A5C1NJ21_9GAMM|nr:MULTISPECIES: antibiotic biosynthesis monooxygenase [Halomonas]QEM82643.1 antibiotic biosynthesis monooxygenase [Halomonas binhaiensis]